MPGADAGARCTPVLTVTKSTSTPNVVNGSSGTSATYTIRAENEVSRATATDVAIGDVLPTGLSYASTTTIGLTGGATRDATVNPAAGATTPSWGTFSIPGGGAVTITFVAAVASSVPAGTVQNPATGAYADLASPGGTATASYDPASSTAEDVTITVPGTSPPPPPAPAPPPPPAASPAPPPPPPPPTRVPVADLAVRVDGPAIAASGDSAPLVVTATNRGPDASPNTFLSITLPAGVTVSGTIRLDGAPTGATCAVTGLLIRCTLGLVPNGQVIVIRLDARLGPPTANVWIVQASVAGSASDPVSSNNAASHTIRTRAKSQTAGRSSTIHHVLRKVALTRRVRPGDPARFRITVRNAGTVAGRNLLVCDLPPRTTTLVSAPGATLRRGQACWRIPFLGAGKRVRLNLMLRVDTAAHRGVLRNIATLKGARRAVAGIVVYGNPRPGDGGGVTG